LAVIPTNKTSANLAKLLSAFDRQSSLGDFVEVSAGELPRAYRRLLDHHSHMTVALETLHGSLVDLRVLATDEGPSSYSRKIVLTRQSDGRVVLFGLVRLDPALLPPEALREIRDQVEPLGRILIRHQVMREVERLRLWRIKPGTELREVFGLTDDQPIFGRTALIHCNGRPAIELLELVYIDRDTVPLEK
jgi:chorismate-pyruvate lyase